MGSLRFNLPRGGRGGKGGKTATACGHGGRDWGQRWLEEDPIAIITNIKKKE